jgi:hypothetical protein
MSSTDKLKQIFKQAELGINSGTDKEIFQDVLQAQQETLKQKPAQPVNIGRIIMKSPITKLATAAIVTFACITGLTIFKGTSNIALGDVLEHIKQVNAVFYQQKMNTVTPIMGMEMKQDMKSKIWLSQDYGMRMDMEMTIATSFNPSEPNGQVTSTQTYLLPKQNQIISIIPSQKQYIRAELDTKQALAARQQGNDPNLMVKQFLDCNYTSLGKSTIDGIEVECFQTTDSNYAGGFYSTVDIKLWVNTKTQLPVKIEENSQLDKQMNTSMHCVTYGFQWDVPVDASTFKPVIPDDYTSATSSSIQMSFDEDALLKGLKLYNEMFDQYPEKLDLAGLTAPLYKLMQKLPQMAKSNDTNDLPPVFKKMKEEMDGLNQEEQKQKTMDFTMELTTSITGLSTFNSQLVQEKKEPVYHGDIVTPQDFDKVLMRWKISENQYRVIFGGLHAETVTSDVLAELEQNLSK